MWVQTTSFKNSSSASDQFTIETDTLPIRFGSGVLPATEQLYHKLVLIVPNHNQPNCMATLLTRSPYLYALYFPILQFEISSSLNWIFHL